MRKYLLMSAIRLGRQGRVMRTWSIRAIVGVALGLTAIVGPGASAGPVPNASQEKAVVLFALPKGDSDSAGTVLSGGCFFVTVRQVLLTSGMNNGFIGDVSIATNAAHIPIPATVQFRILV